jgi:site-specific recombinase XerD
MLGHNQIRTTQIYAKVIDKKVSDDMKKLRQKFLHKKESKDKKGSAQ